MVDYSIIIRSIILTIRGAENWRDLLIQYEYRCGGESEKIFNDHIVSICR
jgi:hypothetical protein